MSLYSLAMNTPENAALLLSGEKFLVCNFDGTPMEIWGRFHEGRADKTPHWRCSCRKCGTLYAIDIPKDAQTTDGAEPDTAKVRAPQPPSNPGA